MLAARRITLVRPHPSYSRDILVYSGDETFYQHLDSSPMAEESEAAGFLESLVADNLTGKRDYWLITNNGSGQAIGTIGFIFTPDLRRHKVAEMGYGLARRWWGSERFREACCCLLDYGFGDLGLERVQVVTRIANSRAAKGTEKLGFQREGILRDFYATTAGARMVSCCLSCAGIFEGDKELQRRVLRVE